MLTQRAQKIAVAISQRTLKRNYHAAGQKFQPPSLNEYPQPSGSWKTYYDSQQRKYNGHLAFGIAFTIGTLIFGQASGCFYLNYHPPAVPAESNSY